MSFKCQIILKDNSEHVTDGGVREYPTIAGPGMHILYDSHYHKVLRTGIHPTEDPKSSESIDATLVVETRCKAFLEDTLGGNSDDM